MVRPACYQNRDLCPCCANCVHSLPIPETCQLCCFREDKVTVYRDGCGDPDFVIATNGVILRDAPDEYLQQIMDDSGVEYDGICGMFQAGMLIKGNEKPKSELKQDIARGLIGHVRYTLPVWNARVMSPVELEMDAGIDANHTDKMGDAQ